MGRRQLQAHIGNPWLRLVILGIGSGLLAACVAAAVFSQVMMLLVWWGALRAGGTVTVGDEVQILLLELQIGVLGILFTVAVGFTAAVLFHSWWRRLGR
jgi:hypothetical protein